MTLEERIKERKGQVTANTIRTYASLLKSLYYAHHEKGSDMNLKWFDNQDHIIELLKDKAPSSRKTTYSALVCIADDNDKYRKQMMSDALDYNKMIKSQVKSEKQSENWKSFDEIKKIYESNYAKVKPLLNSKEELGKKDYASLEDFIILSITCGYWIPPRRSQDWCEMKIKNFNLKEDNCINKGHFIFNKYKTAKFYHEQAVPIPKGLKVILTKWVRQNKGEYLINDHYGKQMTPIKLSQRLNKIFDGLKISTSMLRHIYLTSKLKDVPKLQELEQLATDMGHSLKEQLEYVKH
jgi:integrase